MGRPPLVDRPRKLTLHLTESVLAQLDLLLISDVDGKVPQGAYKTFFEARIREYLKQRPLPLEPYGFPQGYFVTGPTEMVEAVKFFFERNPE